MSRESWKSLSFFDSRLLSARDLDATDLEVESVAMGTEATEDLGSGWSVFSVLVGVALVSMGTRSGETDTGKPGMCS